MKRRENDPLEVIPQKMINELKLNLACGQTNTDEYFGIDIVSGDKVGAVVDLTQFPWPIESNSAEDIICSHYVEHTPKDNLYSFIKKLSKTPGMTFELFLYELSKFDENAPSDGLIKFMEEVYRILKPGGKIKIVAPYYSSIRCWQDPTHMRAISEASFLYYNKAWREANKLDHYNIKCDFDYTYGYDMAIEWATRAEEARNFAMKHYNNVINDIHVVLTKK